MSGWNTRQKFISWLEDVGVHYKTYKTNPLAVYVYGKTQKMYCKTLGKVIEYTPCVRVSGFGYPKLYVRNNGICQYVNEKELEKEILRKCI